MSSSPSLLSILPSYPRLVFLSLSPNSPMSLSLFLAHHLHLSTFSISVVSIFTPDSIAALRNF